MGGLMYFLYRNIYYNSTFSNTLSGWVPEILLYKPIYLDVLIILIPALKPA